MCNKNIKENDKFIGRGYLVGDPSDINLKELKPLSFDENKNQ